MRLAVGLLLMIVVSLFLSVFVVSCVSSDEDLGFSASVDLKDSPVDMSWSYGLSRILYRVVDGDVTCYISSEGGYLQCFQK